MHLLVCYLNKEIQYLKTPNTYWFFFQMKENAGVFFKSIYEPAEAELFLNKRV